MKNKYASAILSLLVPGSGQIYCGKTDRGLLILAVFLVVGNLNAMWLSIHAIAVQGTTNWFGNAFPRLLHDIFALYGIIFLIIQCLDAWFLASDTVEEFI